MIALLAALLALTVDIAPRGEIRTPAAALERIRGLRASGRIPADERVTVRFAPGTCSLDATLELTAVDSNLEFVGAGEGSILSGGVELGAFSSGADGIWRTKVPAELEFDQLWVNGRRATRARSPNRFFHYVYSPLGDPNAVRSGFVGHHEDVEALARIPEDERTNVLIRAYLSWDTEAVRLVSADPSTDEIRFLEPAGKDWFLWKKKEPRYTVENFRAALDAPGEWYHDRKAGELLYVPRAGEDVETSRAVAPRLGKLVDIRGVRNVSFRSISFRYSGFRFPVRFAGHQAGHDIPFSDIEIRDSSDVTFDRCRFEHTASYAVWFAKGTHDSSVTRSLIRDAGGGGVRIGATRDEWRKRRIGLDEVPSRITVDNCILTDLGAVHPEGVGVLLVYANTCRVTHNEICNLFYSGVSQGWDWGYPKESATFGNFIDSNHIHHLGKGVLSDMGGVYTLGVSRGTVISRNIIHDIRSYDHTGHGGEGLYPDEGSSYILYASNIVYRTKTAAFGQHYGRENRLVNNIFVSPTDEDAPVLNRVRAEKFNSYTAEGNIFLIGAGRAAVRGPMTAERYDGGNGYVFRSNLWWSASAPSAQAFAFMDWKTWRDRGQDEGSAFADPRFADAAHGNWDLPPDSPAFGIGFKAWDWRSCGVYGSAKWIAFARGLEMPAFETAPVPPPFQKTRELADDFGRTGPVSSPYKAHGKGILIEDGHLKITDGPSTPGFSPFLTLPLAEMEKSLTLSYSLKFTPGANLVVEFRQNGGGFRNGAYATGPKLIAKNGRFTMSDGKPDGKGGFRGDYHVFRNVRPNEWTKVEFRLKVNPGGRPSYVITMENAAGERESSGEFFSNDEFKVPDWLGFIAEGDRDNTYLIDDLKYRID